VVKNSSNPQAQGCLCPECGHNLDAYLRWEGGSGDPKPNNVALCSYCTAVLIPARTELGNLYFRPATAEDWAQFNDPSEVAEKVLRFRLAHQAMLGIT
jgi:hypothetical protein